MNNINQKNAIMRLQESIGLPYANAGHVAYETATNISQTSLNNTFQQLVDNDLYIENKLANDYAYQIGPKTYNEDKIAAEDNGYKTWGSQDSYELSILRKNEQSLQKSLTMAFPTASYFAVKYSGQYYVGTDDGLVFADSHDGQWRMLQQGRCRGYCLDEGSNVLLFAFSDGIWHLRLSPDNRKKLVKITAGEHDTKAVFFRPDDALLVAAGDYGMWHAAYSKYYQPFSAFEDNFETVVLQQCDIYSSQTLDIEDNVSANVFADIRSGAFPLKTSVFSGTSKGLAQLSAIDDFTWYKALPAGFSYTAVASLSGSIYLGTASNGVLQYDADSSSVTCTSLSSGSTTCLKTFRDSLYACVDGKLYRSQGFGEFELCELSADEASVEIAKSIFFIEDKEAYAFFISTSEDGILYGFGSQYSSLQHLSSLVPELSSYRIAGACSKAKDMRAVLALSSSSQMTIAEVQLPKIQYEELRNVSTASVVKSNGLPAAASQDAPKVLQFIDGQSQDIVVSQHAAYADGYFQLSCGFTKPDGSAAEVWKAKSFPSKNAAVFMFSDNAQISALSLDSLQPAASEFFYIDQLTAAMSAFGMDGVYGFEDTGSYAVLVTKQERAAQPLTCTSDLADTHDQEQGKYFIAYAQTGNAGIPCNKFLRSPVNADEATTQIGTFDSPPQLLNVDGNVILFDPQTGQLSGYMHPVQQQVSFTQTFFSIDHQASDTLAVWQAEAYGNLVFECAAATDENNMQTQHGLYMSQISGATRTAADTYVPAYASFNGKKSKQLIDGDIRRICIDENMMLICSPYGLFRAYISDLSSISTPVQLSDVQDTEAGIAKIAGGDIRDAAVCLSGSIIAAAGSQLCAISDEYMTAYVRGSTCRIGTTSRQQLVVPYSSSIFLQMFADTETEPAKCAMYSIDLNDYSMQQTSCSNVQGALSSISAMAYCSKHVEGDNYALDEPQNDFIAILGENGAVQAVHLRTDQMSATALAGVDGFASICRAGFAVPDQQAGAADSGEDIIDDRILLAAKPDGSLYAQHISQPNETGSWTMLSGAIDGLAEDEEVVHIYARTSKYFEGTQQKPCIYVHQITNQNVWCSRYDIDTQFAPYIVPGQITHSIVNSLPAQLSSAVWTKFNVVDGTLYVFSKEVGDEAGTLHAVVLDGTEVGQSTALDESTISDVDDAYFNFSDVVVRHGSSLYDVEIGYDQQSGLVKAIEELVHLSPSFDIDDSTCAYRLDSTFVCSQISDDAIESNVYIDRYVLSEKALFDDSSRDFSRVIFMPRYQSSSNNYNVYALDGQMLRAYTLNEQSMTIDGDSALIDSSIQQLFMKSSSIEAWKTTADENAALAVQYYGIDGKPFGTVVDADFSQTLVVDSMALSAAMMLDSSADQLELEDRQYSLLNLLLGAPQQYSGLFVIAKQYPEACIVYIPQGTYMKYTAAQTDTKLQLISDSSLLANGHALALSVDTAALLPPEWHEVRKDASLVKVDDKHLRVCAKLASSIIQKAQLSSVDKVACASKDMCFVHGVQLDGEDCWHYMSTSADCQKLDLKYKHTGTSWIDDILSADGIQLADMLETSDGVEFCTNAGLWKSEYKHNYEFNGSAEAYWLDADGNEAVQQMKSIQLHSSGYYRQNEALAKAEYDDSSCSLSGVVLKTDEDGSRCLAFSSQKILDSTDGKFESLHVADDSPYTDILVTVLDQQEEQDPQRRLVWKHGARTTAVEDHRNAAVDVKNTMCVSEAAGLLYVLGDSSQLESTSSFRFESFSRNKTCFKLLDSPESAVGTAQVTMLFPISKSTYAVGLESSIEQIDFSNLAKSTSLHDKGKSYCAAAFQKDDNGVQAPEFFFPCGCDVLRAQPPAAKPWKSVLSVEAGDQQADAVRGLQLDSSKNMLIASDIGLFYTYSKYTLENDIQKLTPNDVLKMFYDNILSVDDTYSTAISAHIKSRHAQDSVITRINNEIMDTKFSNIAEDWTKYDLDSAANGETIVHNDLVHEVKFSELNYDVDKLSSPVAASIRSSVYQEDNIQLNYIMKRWMSGYTELYINLPTTHTYYLNHVLGTPHCTTSPDQLIERKNLSQISSLAPFQRKLNSKPSDNCTHIEVQLDAAEFHVDELVETTIDGNSLPLKIYRDNIDQHYDQASSRLYQSFILPSVAEDGIEERNGKYCFKFACFGTDAQAVKIAFNDYVHRYGAKFFTIEFNNNAGAGALQSQQVPLDGEVNLRANTSIYKADAAFLGWSIKATVDGMSQEPMFFDSGKISKAILESKVKALKVKAGSIVTLFAVWQPYELPDSTSYTVLQIDCPTNSTQIAPVSSYKLDSSVKPYDALVIDYGD